jgi:hypothetical protein
MCLKIIVNNNMAIVAGGFCMLYENPGSPVMKIINALMTSGPPQSVQARHDAHKQILAQDSLQNDIIAPG